MKKKLCALMMALVLAMSMMPVGAFATEGDAAAPDYENQVGSYWIYDADRDKIIDKSGPTEAPVNSVDDGGIELSKTIEQTGKDSFDITLRVKSVQDLRKIHFSPDSAVVLVIDTSGSMQYKMDGTGWCNNEDCDNYGEPIGEGLEKDCPWTHKWGINPNTGENISRFAIAAEGLAGFLDAYADGSDAKRMLSIVRFGQEAQTDLEWVDVNDSDNKATAADKVTYDELISQIYSQTAQGIGLDVAYGLLGDKEIEGISNRYVILLTDGRPEGDHPPGEGNVSGAHGTTIANKIKDYDETIVQTIGFGTESIAMYDTTYFDFVNDWLREAVASVDANEKPYFVPAQDLDDLNLGLAGFTNTILQGASLYTVNDPMGDFIEYVEEQVLETEFASYDPSEDTLVWNLLEEEPVVEDDVYIYELTYSIKLESGAEGFVCDNEYPANDATTLKYVSSSDVKDDGSVPNGTEVKTGYFNVPTVFAPGYTVTYEYIAAPAGAPALPEGGTYVEGADVTIADAPSMEGYVFLGWNSIEDENGNEITPADGTFEMPRGDVVIKGTWAAKPADIGPSVARYEVHYYTQNADRTYSEVTEDSYVVFAAPGTEVQAAEKAYEGYVKNEELTTDKGVVIAPSVNEAGELEILRLEVYFDLTYTVTYTDGVENSEVFPDQVTPGLLYGVDTPAFDGTPTRSGYSFRGWTPVVQDIVTGDAVYVATWSKKSTPPPSIPDNPPPLNKVDHYGYIIGYPKDYETGERTEDQTRMPVMPEGNITRAEVATIFFRMLTDEGRADVWSQTSNYSDVELNDWFNNAVCTLSNAGIINGYADGTFRPNANITRAEFATIASRFFDAVYEGEDIFPDIDGHWAADYINNAANNGIIQGYPDGTFGPNKKITRAEAVTMVNRTLDRTPDKDYLLKDMLVWVDNMDTTKWYYADMQEATNSHAYDMVVKNDGTMYEKWTKMLPIRDWAELEREWSDSNSAPGGEVVK